MADDAAFSPGLSPLAGKPVQVTFDAGRLTSDGGVLMLAEIERSLGTAERLARCFEDPPGSVPRSSPSLPPQTQPPAPLAPPSLARRKPGSYGPHE